MSQTWEEVQKHGAKEIFRKDYRRSVSYTPIGYRTSAIDVNVNKYAWDDPKTVTINWSSFGSVPIETAKNFRDALNVAIADAEIKQAELEAKAE